MAGYGFRCTKCTHEEVSDTSCNNWPCPKCGIGSMWHDINVRHGTLDAYVWPGGYPLIYIIGSDILCNKCAVDARDSEDGCTPIMYDTYMEGPPEYCEECGTIIDSAYGDPEAEKEE